MTPLEIHEAMKAIVDEVDLVSTASVVVNDSSKPEGTATLLLYIRGNDHLSVRADNWPELFRSARAKLLEAVDRLHGEVVKKLALAIIRITHEQGECTDQALRVEFGQQDIDRYGEEAVAAADQMASNGPFRIVATAGANAA